MEKEQKTKKVEDSTKVTVDTKEVIILPRKINFEQVDIPENMKLWSDESEMSNEFKVLLQDCLLISVNLANEINSGPEVKENTAKRMLVFRTVQEMFLNVLCLDTYQKVGVLSEMIDDLFVKGRMDGMKMIQELKAKKIAEQSNENLKKGGEKFYV